MQKRNSISLTCDNADDITRRNKGLEVNRNCQRWHILAESAICNGDFGRIMQQFRSCRPVPACQPCRLRYFSLTCKKNEGGSPSGVTVALATHIDEKLPHEQLFAPEPLLMMQIFGIMTPFLPLKEDR